MVFTKLSAQEKDAFFGLLDEYFQSRPELFSQSGGGGGQGVSGLAGTGISTSAAASVVQRALTTNATSSNGGGTAVKSNNPYAAAITTPSSADVANAVAVGRVAAASLAFSQAGGGGASSSPSPLSQIQHPSAGFHLKHPTSDGPPSLPRRAASNAPVPASAPGEQTPGAEVDKLVARKASVFNAFKKPPTAGVSIPPAFAAPKSAFGPPPVRRTTSETNTGPSTGGAAPMLRVAGAPGTRSPQPPPAPKVEVAEGEWAEVLYDYSSEDPGDLAIEAGTRVFVTAKSSEDWWTGQVEGQGREGLFPASYVKPL